MKRVYQQNAHAIYTYQRKYVQNVMTDFFLIDSQLPLLTAAREKTIFPARQCCPPVCLAQNKKMPKKNSLASVIMTVSLRQKKFKQKL